ncbi:guanylate cyclase soluble subunit beta-1-like [Paramacrobiotus metropolitanus]|uniref:guanylate cyclase soluble subunit beta-1-like n=1 Tax=Paramacrobiotus metropolitanus TaxID=2943436 RepID=UPI0024458761|nr:guanylate cyclase soluble subunit beta-1-like [Paramacrobiotus metropolitanus]XP_055342761.1 guanylate cyclase soluble subunit beta-1-like [Paramacrobiotus metropolitanus]XP_055342762.1 guanylate cyclase soluble subunit beta-1-like [Paramacrobiotus metropolitanus]XP_055342763.1 guanylate cyclase soluble subunit beta-1-like [Paramacrobiotus metropolitanus]
MHGLINRCLELMVIEKFGEDFWTKLKKEADIKLSGEFLTTEFYSDESTYKMVFAAERLTGVPADKILEMYGEYFYEFSVEFQYDKLLRVLGNTPEKFLQCLDTMHLALARVYPPMRPPLFTCKKLPDGDHVIGYYSKRPALLPIAVGLIRRAILGLFNISIEITVLSTDTTDGCYKMLIKNLTGSDTVEAQRNDEELVNTMSKKTGFMSPLTFTELFPYHILFDRDFNVLQCGQVLFRVMPWILDADSKLNSWARIARPYITLTYEHILDHLNTTFLLEVTSAADEKFRLNGQIIHLLESDLLLFIGSPYVVSLDDLYRKGFSIADIALYDAKRDFLLASETFDEERKLFKRLEDLTNNLQETARLMAVEKARTDQLIYDILPRPVAKQLKMGEMVVPQRYESVTILFSGIVNFDKFCLARDSDKAGIEVVDLLNNVYKHLDKLLEPSQNAEVYKIETIQDNYLVVSGAPEPTLYHAKRISRLALQMMERVQFVKIGSHHVKLTIGINSGEVVAGVIGNRMPRYCLFGDSVNLASRTLKTGKPGRINVAFSTYKLLQTGYNFTRDFQFDYYGEVIMKNVKQPVQVWLLDRKTESYQKNISRLCEIA